MKRLLPLISLLAFLCVNTEVGRLPALLRHYFEHAGNDAHGPASFAGYLKDHYKEDAHADADHDHKKLPFKSSGCAGHTSIVTTCQAGFTFSIHEHHTGKASVAYKEDHCSSSAPEPEGQPPQV